MFGDREEFLQAVPKSRNTYSAGLDWFEKYLLTLPEYRGEEKPLRLFLIRVDDDQNRPKRERRQEDRTVLRGFIAFMVKNGLLEKSVGTYMDAVQSFGSFNEIELTTKFLNMPKAHVRTKSHPWVRQELERFLKLLEVPMYQSICSTFVQSGLSIIDTLDIKYDDIKVEFEAGITPLLLDFTQKGRHKTEVEFRTFVGAETVELLKRHFAINPPEEGKPIFPITERAVQDYFARRAKVMLGEWKYRNPMSPHTFRKYFRKKMVNADCPSEYVEYMMGHDLETDLRKIYTEMTNDEWRAIYAQFGTKPLSFKIPKDEDMKGGKAGNV